MQGHRAELAGLESQAIQNERATSALEISIKRIDHHIADEPYLIRRYAFPKQVLVCVQRWRKQQIRQRVGDYSINLFGHCAVAASKSCFDVCDSNKQLRSDHCRGH